MIKNYKMIFQKINKTVIQKIKIMNNNIKIIKIKNNKECIKKQKFEN